MRALLLIVLAVVSTRALADATACPIEGCGLSPVLHSLNGFAGSMDEPVYSYLVHDLALARLALAEGDRALALELATTAHLGLSTQSAWILRSRGKDFAMSLHQSLTEVIVAAGGERPDAPALVAMN